MAEIAEVRLSFPARPEFLLLARLVVAGALRRLGFAERDIADLKLAVTEACGNAVRHGYAGGMSGSVDLELVSRSDRLDVVVADSGSGIALPLPERPRQLTQEGGMGLSIIRTVVDDVEITRGPGGRGTVVHMVKRGAPRANGGRRDEADRSRV